MDSRIVLGGLVAAVSVAAFGLTPQVSAQQTDAAANLAEDGRVVTSKGAWNPNVTYKVDDLVTSRGSTWRSKINNNKGKVPGSTNPSTATAWELFARGFNPLGAWSGGTKYNPNDLVTFQGATWRAKLTSTSVTPVAGANWEKLAAAGATGATGPTGPQGPAGPNTGIGKGSQATPAISFSSDSNTGIFSPSAGKIALVEDGALFLHNKGDQNTALGLDALSNTSGDQNTAVGSAALGPNTSGFGNAAVGTSALGSNTTGNDNIAMGNGALQSNDSGSSNTALGSGALTFNLDANNNVAVGYNALRNNNGAANVGVGAGALLLNNSGTENIAIGFNALGGLSSGIGNIGIGSSAGANASASGNNNIFIGSSGSGAGSDEIQIGADQTKTVIAGIRNATVSGGAAVEIDANGQLGTVAPSSRRYKKDIQPMTGMGSLLQQLRPVTFRYKKPLPDGTTPIQYGLIAEEVVEVLPALTLFDKEGRPDGVRYQVLPSLLLAGYQQQQKVIDAQAARIDTLEQRLAALEAKLGTLASR